MEETIEITRKATVPKGDICLWCKYVDTETKPKICAMNGEITRYDTEAFCRFFNEPLFESKVVDDRIPCCPRRYYKKCYSCSTANMSDEEKAVMLFALYTSLGWGKGENNGQEKN